MSFARFSTSTKMLLILTLALLPLGLIASLASVETARANRANRVLAAHLLAGDTADRLSLFLDRAAVSLRAAARPGGTGCRHAADEIGGANSGIAVAVFEAGGGLRCGMTAAPPPRPAGPLPDLAIDPPRQVVRVTVAAGRDLVVADLPRAVLAQESHPNAIDGSYDLRIDAPGGGALSLATLRTVSIGRDILTTLPVAGGRLRLLMTVEAAPLSANELLLMLLPLLMWVAAAAIGWLVVDRLILRPLAELQRAVDLYRLRGGRLELPVLTTPAHEIRVLGDALSAATSTISRHEADLEDGLARQTKLTREVHHRVKNNLQVVASLLNIHARGARAPEAVAAYGAIQRRVDALALVHRSHYAELEVNRGVALRPLIGELAANLRGSAPPGMRPPRILLDTRLLYATQDVAVPVAFLVTELVELAMFRAPGTAIEITLGPAGEGDRSRLAVRSDALRRDAAPVDQAYERGERVVGGLARQLRSKLEVQDETGTFALDIPVMPEDNGESPHAGPAGDGGTLVPRHIAG